VRERPAGFTGTPMPKDEPLAPNPPLGAYIDYVLDVATIRADHAGNLRRAQRARAPLPQRRSLARARSVQDARGAGMVRHPVTLQTTPGMHRFVWPIRYEGTRGTWSDGVWAPPGDYRVALTIDGHRRRSRCAWNSRCASSPTRA
jgi:hypothetical protein